MPFMLINAAMVPNEGTFMYAKIDRNRAADWLHTRQGNWTSYIGYEQTRRHVVDVMHKMTCDPAVKQCDCKVWPVKMSREKCEMRPGDQALVCKLRYRLDNPATKGEPQEEDWEYGLLTMEHGPNCAFMMGQGHCSCKSTGPQTAQATGPQTGAEAEAAGRAAYREATNPAWRNVDGYSVYQSREEGAVMTSINCSIHTWQREYDYERKPMRLKEVAPLRLEARVCEDIGEQAIDKVSIDLSLDLFLHPSHTIQIRDALTALIEARASCESAKGSLFFPRDTSDYQGPQAAQDTEV
jgi:hypothetical protein